MVRPCKRRKVKNPSGKVSRHASKNVKKCTAVQDVTVGRFWNSQKTIHQNFAAVGLVSKVNADLSTSGIKHKLEEWQTERVEKLIELGEENLAKEEGMGELASLMRPMLDEQAIFSRLEDLFNESEDAEVTGDTTRDAPKDVKKTVVEELEFRSKQVAPKKPERLSEFERQYIEACIKKHGTDYKKMSLDVKTNSRQLTARELERMAEKLNN